MPGHSADTANNKQTEVNVTLVTLQLNIALEKNWSGSKHIYIKLQITRGEIVSPV